MASLLPSDPAAQRKLLIGLIPLLAAFAYYYFIHQGQTLEVEQMRGRLEALEAKNAAARARAARGSRGLEQRLVEFQKHIGRLERLVPRKEEVPDLLHELTQRAQTSGVELALMRPTGEQTGGLYTRQSYDLIVFGSYHNVARFLTEVGSLPRIIRPVDLELRPRSGDVDGSGQQRLEAAFSIVTYVLPQGQAAAQQANATS